MINIAICDDDKNTCSFIEDIILKLIKSLEKKVKIKLFYSGETLCRELLDGSYYDIIFLDIELQTTNGVEVGHRIRDMMHNETTQIIYISGKDSYAMDLFDVRPFDFLIKPILTEKIEKVLRKFLRITSLKTRFFEYKKGQTKRKIQVKEIRYFESSGKKINIYINNGIIQYYGKLSAVKQQLIGQDFLFIHKSYLVNLLHVIEYRYDHLKMSDKKLLPISRQHKKIVQDKLSQQRIWEA